MTCQELRRYFEDLSCLDEKSGAEADHLALCPACASFVETRQKLAAGLQAIRESTPQCPGTVDSAVLAHYRRRVANSQLSANSNSRGFRFAWVASSAAAAALLVVVALYFVGGRAKDTATIRPQAAGRASLTSQPLATNKSENLARLSKPTGSHAVRHRHASPTIPAVVEPPLPTFQSLMYCDELSCGGPMQLIRVRLPAPGTAFTPSSAAASGQILADVLVGPEGVARGIRIVE